jgi:hypothetical protein
MAITLITTLSLLPDYQPAAGGSYIFSLNVVPVSDVDPTTDLATDPDWLKPWAWPQVTNIFWKAFDPAWLTADFDRDAPPAPLPAPGAPVPPPVWNTTPPLSIIASPIDKTTPGWRAFTDFLSTKYVASKKVWNPAEAPGPEPKWHDFLAHYSTSPAPIAQALGLTYFFSIPKTQLGAINTGFSLVAIPEVRGKNPGAVVAGRLVGGNFSPVAADGTVKVTMALPPPIDVFAQILPLPLSALARPTTNSQLDLNRGWVNFGGLTSGNPLKLGVDWRSDLEVKISNVFDLPSMLLKAYDNDRNAAAPQIAPADWPSIRDLVVATLRDGADLGLRQDPSGICLAEQVLAAAIRLLPTPLAETQIRDQVAQLVKVLMFQNNVTLAQWKSLLAADENVSKLNLNVDVSWNVDGNFEIGKFVSLQNLVRSFNSDDVLRALLNLRWNAIITGYINDPATTPAEKNATQAAWNYIASTLLQALNNRALLPRLRLGVIGLGLYGTAPANPIWRTLTAITPTTNQPDAQLQQFKDNAKTAALSYLTNRNNPAAAGDFLPTVPNAVPGASLAVLTGTATTGVTGDITAFLNTITTGTGAAADDLAVSTPHSLIFPVDRLEDVGGDIHTGSSANPAQSATDLLRQIGGLGLVIRRATNTPSNWRCANLADIYFHPAAAPEATDVLLCQAVPVPVRVTYRQNLKSPYLTYDGKPMVAGSPLSKAGQIAAGEGPGANDALVFKPATYIDPNSHNPVKFPLPILAYGCDYEIASFIMGTAGTLPPELIGGTNYATLNPGWKPPADINYRATLAYHRRVRVGPPRFAPHDDSQKNAPSLPFFPPEVTTLAAELGLVGKNPPVANAPNDKKLILLWDNRDTRAPANQFNFALRPPATDMDNWQRWVALDQSTASKNLQKLVLTGYFAGASENARNKRTANDLTFNDPAVSGFTLTLTPKWPTPAAASVTTTLNFKALTTTAAKQGLEYAQWIDIGAGALTDRIKMTVKIAAPNAVPAISIAGDTVTVTVPTGMVAELAIIPIVSTSDALRFEGNLLVNNIPAATLTYIIEVAQGWPVDQATAEQDFWKQLAFSEVNPAGQAVAPYQTSATLGPNAAAPNLLGLYYAAHHTQVTFQQWRWQGEVLPPPPLLPPVYDGTPAAFTTLRQWEANAFENRPASDSSTYESGVSWVQDAPHPGLRTIFMIDETSDLRARYYRFGLTVRNRYEALPGLDNVRPIKASLNVIDPVTQQTVATTRWKPHFRNSRVKELFAPQVRFAFPLTRQSENLPTSFCVVLLENPYDHYGLGITLVPKMLSVKNLAAEYYQIGADPITTGRDGKILPAPAVPPVVPFDQSITGRGLTFDTNVAAPRFHAASYTLTLDQSLWKYYGEDANGNANPFTNQATPFGHWMFRFQLCWQMNGVNAPVATEGPVTPPIEMQLLPNANRFVVSTYKPATSVATPPCALPVIDVGTLMLAKGAIGTGTYLTQDTQGIAVDLRPDFSTGTASDEGSGTVEHRLLLIVTRVEKDAFGQESEKFCGINWSPANNGTWSPVRNSPANDPGDSFRGRIIEIQYRKASSADIINALSATGTSTMDWKSLFFGNLDLMASRQADQNPLSNDVLCRCIRFSAPMEGQV